MNCASTPLVRCGEGGYEPTFHHETGAHVQAAWEIEKMLELTSIDLCLDAGHPPVGGGVPMQALKDWGSRIDHIHLKDARATIVDAIVRDAAPAIEIWRRGAFCAPGKSKVDPDSVLDSFKAKYQGWLVVEQNVLPDSEAPERPAKDRVANRRYLAARGL